MHGSVATAPERSGLARAVRVQWSRDDLAVGAIAYVALVALICALAVLQPATFTFEQIGVYAGQSLVVATIAVGQSIVLLSGGIDLSVGGTLSMTNVVAALVMTSEPLAVVGGAAVVALGCALGLLNGLIVVVGKLESFIVTLGTWFIWSGAALLVLPEPGGAVATELAAFVSSTPVGIPVPYIILAVIGAIGAWFLRTRPGLMIRATGSVPVAAQQSGIRRSRAVLLAFTLSGGLTGLAAIMLCAQNLSGDPNSGTSYLLPAIAAAVIGGTSLTGGTGGVVGSIIGALVLTYVAAVTFAASLPSQWGLVLQGAILASAVALQHLLRTAFSSRRSH
jgi:ribose transport system permease protein